MELAVGTGEEETLLWAHQAMLIKSPYFAEICGQFDAGATVSSRSPSFPSRLLGYRRPLQRLPLYPPLPNGLLAHTSSNRARVNLMRIPTAEEPNPAQPPHSIKPKLTTPPSHSIAASTSQTTTSPPQAQSSNTSTTANTSRAASPPPKTRPSNPTPLSRPPTPQAPRSSSTPKSTP